MTVENEVANLTTAVDSLTEEVNVKKQTLDASVADGESARDQSQGYRDEARTARDEAQGHANTAAQEAQDALSAVSYQDLTAIAESKAETAVDVFVYDTSRDSDGGAWRKRTQGTSWYNETLNTATRGARREFPAVAVIVAETDKLTIYDGDDPALPMWMVFNGTYPSMVMGDATTGGLITTIAMLDGVLVAGTGDGSNFNAGLVTVSFPGDSALRYRPGPSASVQGYYNGGISERNAAKSYSGYVNQGLLVNDIINDVAMTVLPDAPIDPATGLPVPTIAVATDGGVSVIKDDGTVVDISDSSSKEFYQVSFFGKKLMVQQNYLDYSPWVLSIPNSDVTGWDYQGFPSGITLEEYSSTGSIKKTGADLFFPGESGDRNRPMIATGTKRYISSASGLSMIAANEAAPSSGMVAYTTSTYNTGWMPGDIKGAFLSDTDDTDLVGSGELVTNGTFDTDTDWTKGTGWTISGGVASFDASVAGAGVASPIVQDISVEAGKTYVATVRLVSATNMEGNEGFAVIDGQNLTNENSPTLMNPGGLYTTTYTATETGTVTISVRSGGITDGDETFSVDDFSVKLADADRSVNNNGLIVNGTVTRSPVATGADLVAYSGFSASNYLEAPYNPDLDFGTGDFAVMGWFKIPAGNSGALFSRLDTSATPEGIFLYSDPSDNIYGKIGPYNTSADTSVVPHPTGAWAHTVFLRRSGTLELYLNGRLVSQTANTENANGTNGDGRVAIGSRPDGGAPSPGSLALWRISATAPTAEQIKKIYEDEKVLFQDGAQATLYGSSDAVTALAHDPVTDLLHVSTSDGRSDFQGLRRVSNTTDAHTSLSASNGLIVGGS